MEDKEIIAPITLDFCKEVCKGLAEVGSSVAIVNNSVTVIKIGKRKTNDNIARRLYTYLRSVDVVVALAIINAIYMEVL